MSGDFMRDLAAQRAADEATERLLATVHAAGVAAGIAWATEAQRYREGRALEVPPMPTYPGRDARGALSAPVSENGAGVDPGPTDDLTGPQRGAQHFDTRETR